MFRALLVALVVAGSVSGAYAACPDGRVPNVTVIDRYPLQRIRQSWARAGLPNAASLVAAINYLGAGRSCFGSNKCVIWIASDRSATERARDLSREMANACGRPDPHRNMMDNRWLPDPRWTWRGQ